jgi:type 1 glutamine amidotransferase/nicotinamidase-related amidase
MHRRKAHRSVLSLLFFLVFVSGTALRAEDSSALKLEARVREAKAPEAKYQVSNQKLNWDPAKTAVVVCDMWNQHWCRGATSRVAEMAPRMNEVITAARQQGILIVHCPSSCLSFYKDTPMRQRAQQAPKVETKIALQGWCHLDADREGDLPIDDSDGGCDCWPPCESGSPWTRQIDTIEVADEDAVTDNAEAYYLMKQRGIENVIVMGVHTNMCVLGRPFSIRQMVYQGQNVVLMRDMTDTMYNSRMAPFVKHTEGTDLVIEHIEKFWCPTITSTAFTGQPAFEFSERNKPHVVVMIGESEYETKDTLPIFAEKKLEPAGLRCTVIHVDADDGNKFPGIESLKTADVLLLSVRRRALPAADLKLVREFVERGGSVVGIRTANHAFHTRGQRPDGHAEWQEFDAQVLGGNYTGHHGNGPKAELRVAESANSHAILQSVSVDSMIGNGSLYKVSPLAKTATPLLLGTVPDHPTEPVAWTHAFGDSRIFYTSLGHPKDFESEGFQRLLLNAVTWAARVEH